MILSSLISDCKRLYIEWKNKGGMSQQGFNLSDSLNYEYQPCDDRTAIPGAVEQRSSNIQVYAMHDGKDVIYTVESISHRRTS